MIPDRPAAIVCDMDGLLVDSERLEWRCWTQAARDLGLGMSDERFLTFVGLPNDMCEPMMLGYYGPDFDLAAFRARCAAHMRAIVDHEGIALRPGALDWVDWVSALGIPLAVATSSGPIHARERLGTLHDRFQAVVTRPEVARGKPYPDLYLEAARRLGVLPRDALALEDSPTGARAAIAAGMPVLLVPDLVQPPPELVAQSAGVYESLIDVRAAAARAWGA